MKFLKKRTKIILIITVLIVLLGTVLGIIDYNRIKNGYSPLFMIRVSGTQNPQMNYLGLGYRMSRETNASPKEPINSSIWLRFGFWFFTWNVEVDRSSHARPNNNEVVELTEEQYQLLKDNILYSTLEEMNYIRQKNSWLIITEMLRVGFVENVYPGESNVGTATRIFEVLDVGIFNSIEIIDFDNDDIRNPGECCPGVNGYFNARIISQQGDLYYMRFCQIWGLTTVRKNNEVVYSVGTHRIIDGKIIDIDFSRPNRYN